MSTRARPADLFRRDLVNKTVPWKFMGRDLTFALSHALFSSYAIDSGSSLLLKTVAQKIDLERVGTCLDLGAGVGVLGLSVKARFPDIRLTATDRDALALDFTAANAAANGIMPDDAGFAAAGCAGLMGLPPGPFDLILSNIPAKAGEKTIASWLLGLTSFLPDSGTLAFVIVRTLVDRAARTLAAAGYEITHREATREHTVFHARRTVIHRPDLSLGPYLRGEMPLTVAGGRVVIETVTGLGEFDTLSYATHLLLKACRKIDIRGNVLFWNPGQGHLAVTLLKEHAARGLSVTLAGRDRLSLEASLRNCLAAGAPAESIGLCHAPSLWSLSGSFDRAIVIPDSDAGVPWQAHLLPSLAPLLAPQGIALLSARSSFFGRMDLSRGVSVARDTRARGFRCLALKDLAPHT